MPVKQTTPWLFEPTKFLRNGIIRGEITHFEDEVIMEGLSNAITVGNVAGYKIDKNKHTAKLDVVDSLVHALYEGMHYFDKYTNVEQPKSKNFMDGWGPEQINEYYMNLTL